MGPLIRYTKKIFLDIVKLHSDLRILTQLQLDGEEVDFAFPRKKKEGRTTTHT